MLLGASYSTKAGGRRIGRNVEYSEQSKNPILRAFGIGKKKRCTMGFEPINVTTAQEIVSQLLSENGFLILGMADGRSSVDFADAGGNSNHFFIEQYFDTIYGGIYDLPAAKRIVETIFQGCSSEELRDLFPQLPGELVYEYQGKKT